jgi:hypothetical protein
MSVAIFGSEYPSQRQPRNCRNTCGSRRRATGQAVRFAPTISDHRTLAKRMAISTPSFSGRPWSTSRAARERTSRVELSQLDHLAGYLRLAHQFGGAVCNSVGRGQQHRVGGMHVSRRDRSALVAHERGNRGFAVAEIARQ